MVQRTVFRPLFATALIVAPVTFAQPPAVPEWQTSTVLEFPVWCEGEPPVCCQTIWLSGAYEIPRLLI
ncbi:MAG: hypothetical protein JWQ49_5360 [Edaphobacter sp.]|nr:hypothetical protein [Edaphobacter sp.]